MALIYPKEAHQRFGPPPIVVIDAKGNLLRNVVASDPCTGEVIQRITDQDPVFTGIFFQGIFWVLVSPFLRRFGIEEEFTAITRHYFAPAPLSITRLVAKDD